MSLPDLSEDWSCSESDKHCLSIWSSNHLHLPCLYDVHLPAHLTLSKKKEADDERERAIQLPKIEKSCHIQLSSTKKHMQVCLSPFCRHNPQVSRQQSEGFSACQRSSVCHNPVERDDKKKEKTVIKINKNLLVAILALQHNWVLQKDCFHSVSSILGYSFHVFSYLKKRDFADNGVVDIYSNVQTHFIWQLSQQLLFIWKADDERYIITERSRVWDTCEHAQMLSLPSMPWDCQV